MPRLKNPYNVDSRIKAALRKIWFYSKLRRDAVKRANGKCELCHKPQSKFQVDHIKPIVSVKTGFTDWDDYIKAMLYCGLENLQAICLICHESKTLVETHQRKIYKKKNGKKIKNTN